MSNVVSYSDRARIQDEASLWLAKLDGGELSGEDSRAFRLWLNASAEHRDMIKELAQLWDNMEILSDLSDLFPLQATDEEKALRPKRFFNIPRIPAAALASVAILFVLVLQLNGGLFNGHSSHPGELKSTYKTSVGEQENVSLPDGSESKLNTDTFVEVAYSQKQRDIRLVKGEAHFNVAHDSDRPFIVHAGSGVVRAVGTAFTVRIKGDDVDVMVTEGSVEIASAGTSISTLFSSKDDAGSRKFLTRIAAGQSAEYGSEKIHSVETVEPELMARKLSWQHGMLMFKGDPLEEVVEEISRYTETRIVISDPEILHTRVGGYFKAGETEALLAVLEDNFNITAKHLGKNLVSLAAAENHPDINPDTRQ